MLALLESSAPALAQLDRSARWADVMDSEEAGTAACGPTKGGFGSGNAGGNVIANALPSTELALALPDRAARWADIMEAEEAGETALDLAGSGCVGLAFDNGGEASLGASGDTISDKLLVAQHSFGVTVEDEAAATAATTSAAAAGNQASLWPSQERRAAACTPTADNAVKEVAMSGAAAGQGPAPAPMGASSAAVAAGEKAASASASLMQAPASLTPWTGPTILSAPRLGGIQKCKCVHPPDPPVTYAVHAKPDSGFPEFSLPDFLARQPNPSPLPPRPQGQGRGEEVSPPPALQRLRLYLGRVATQLLELVHAEVEVRHCISQRRLAEMELRSSLFASLFAQPTALRIDRDTSGFFDTPALSGTPFAFPLPAAPSAGGDVSPSLGEGGRLTRLLSRSEGESQGAHPPHGCISWGEGDHNHPLPQPRRGSSPLPLPPTACPRLAKDACLFHGEPNFAPNSLTTSPWLAKFSSFSIASPLLATAAHPPHCGFKWGEGDNNAVT